MINSLYGKHYTIQVNTGKQKISHITRRKAIETLSQKSEIQRRAPSEPSSEFHVFIYYVPLKNNIKEMSLQLNTLPTPKHFSRKTLQSYWQEPKPYILQDDV